MTGPKVYLAGGIAGLTDEEAKGWRDEAARRLHDLYDVLDPMVRDYRGIEDDNVEAIISGDLADIAAADVLLVRAERPSWGTAMELVYAKQLGKKIVAFGAGPRPSPWLVHHCDELVRDLDHAITYVVSIWHGIWESKQASAPRCQFGDQAHPATIRFVWANAADPFESDTYGCDIPGHCWTGAYPTRAPIR